LLAPDSQVTTQFANDGDRCCLLAEPVPRLLTLRTPAGIDLDLHHDGLSTLDQG
jgi:hypothetical protein